MTQYCFYFNYPALDLVCGAKNVIFVLYILYKPQWQWKKEIVAWFTETNLIYRYWWSSQKERRSPGRSPGSPEDLTGRPDALGSVGRGGAARDAKKDETTASANQLIQFEPDRGAFTAVHHNWQTKLKCYVVHPKCPHFPKRSWLCLVDTEKHAQEDTKTRLDRDYPQSGTKSHFFAKRDFNKSLW